MKRRSLFKWLIGGAGAAMGAAALVPSLITALSPMRRRAQLWRPVGALESLASPRVVRATIEKPLGEYPVVRPGRAVYVWTKLSGEVVVFSPTCTDLGCTVNYDPGSEFYYCPCHGGIFNREGEPVAGPPAEPLYRYATRVRGGVLEIDLKSVPLVA